ncbi:MAG: hypothetical protein ACI86H_001881 [bacterium]|jgi:hypothetical protein
MSTIDLEGLLVVPTWGDDDHNWKVKNHFLESDKKGWLGFFQGTELDSSIVSELRKEFHTSAGVVLGKVQTLLKKHPENPDLLILDAACKVEFNDKSKEFLTVLRFATKQCLRAISNNGISVYNIEKFMSIYFRYLHELRLEQISLIQRENYQKTYPHEYRKQLSQKIIESTVFLNEKIKVDFLMRSLKQKVKSSRYYLNITVKDVIKAWNHVDKEQPEAEGKVGNARTTVDALFMVISIFSRIPVLKDLNKDILAILADSSVNYYLRQLSVLTNEQMIRYRITKASGQPQLQRDILLQSYQENLRGIRRMQGRPILTKYHAEPFLAIINITFLMNLFATDRELEGMLRKCLEATYLIMTQDETEKKQFAAVAHKYKNRIKALLE